MPQDFRSELRYEGLIVRVNLLPSSVLGIPMNPCQCLPYHSGLEEHGHLLRLIPDTETRTTHIRSTSIRRTSRNCGRMEFGCIPKSIPVPMDRLGGSLPVSSEACAAVFAHSAQPLQQSSSADTDNSRCGADDADRRGGLHRDAGSGREPIARLPDAARANPGRCLACFLRVSRQMGIFYRSLQLRQTPQDSPWPDPYEYICKQS